jgi:hypothetical protein
MKITAYVRGVTSTLCGTFKVTLDSNSMLLFLKLFFFEFMLGISEIFLYSMSYLLAKITLMLDDTQLLMLFTGTLMYLEPKQFLLIVFYNGTFLTIKY